MDTGTLLIALMRPLERLLAVGIGGLSVYLGYRLFLSLPDRTDSQGQVILPGGVDVRLSRIGPGAFFALFGALVVGFALYQAVRVEVPAGTQVATAASRPDKSVQGVASKPSPGVVSYAGVGTAVVPSNVSESTLAELRRDLHDLSNLASALGQNADAAAREEAAISIEGLTPKLRLALLQRSWAASWGDFGRFDEWVRAGAADPVRLEFVQPAALLRHAAGEREEQM
ncbi:hypothetical protein [Immundisolibacter sp.]|uniref:hypothetical protein n=1 Tax=Immundisolibacter sp. TaxID=1934948 RepID=UPI003568AF1F